jgi:hypothetical protein
MIRKPLAAGQFYPADESSCAGMIDEFLSFDVDVSDLPSHIVCGVVPHAGWVFSGDLAVKVFESIKKQNGRVDTFLLFGASHRYGGMPAVFDSGKWETPVGDVEIDEKLAGELVSRTNGEVNKKVHGGEHSIEVQVPIIKQLFEGSMIVPVLVAGNLSSIEFGRSCGDIVSGLDNKERVVCIASTDLTHYGRGYGFCPEGTGSKGVEWAKEVNDRDFLDSVVKMDSEGVLNKGLENMSSCGPGAVAAAVEAAGKLGADKGVVIGHTHSSEVMKSRLGRSGGGDSVGYAGIVF